MGRKGTRSLADLKISEEVGWYLNKRGIPLPDCPPKFKTPEPGEVLEDARFDPKRVDRVLASFRMLRHTQGRFAGRPLTPDPWQIAYFLGPVFGWVTWSDEADAWVRVVNEGYVDVPRKNGKTTKSGGLALYLTAADGEPGAQVIAAATTKDQAGFTFAPVKSLAEHSPDLKPYLKTYQGKILHPRSGSYFQVVSSVAEALHGANLHGGIIDELHVHKTPDLVEAIETGTGSRTQPLIIIITTADDGTPGTIYARKRRRIEQIAQGLVTLPSVYGVIWAADETDDPFAEATWRKANPGYGISPTKAYLAKASAKAKDDPAELASFLRLHLGLRTKLDKQYIQYEVWDRNSGPIDVQALAGRKCYGGLDLAATSDLTALCWLFPDGQGGHDVLWRHWVPERAYDQLIKRTAGEARVWHEQGWLTVTEGDVTDYDYVRAAIKADRETYDVQTIGYDRWNSSQLVNDLVHDGADMIEVGQGMTGMTAGTKALLHNLLLGHLRHGDNPLVRWQVGNLRVVTDAAGNVKPAKDKSPDKIDGLVAEVMAIDGTLRAKAKDPEPQIWIFGEDG